MTANTRSLLVSFCVLPFLAMASSAVTSATSGYWTNTATWGGSVPGPGEDVIIAASHTVTVDVHTATLNTFSNDGALVFSGWTNTTSLSATSLIINATITHLRQTATSTNPSGQWVPDHAVFILCSNLTVLTGKAINANGKGWQGGVASNSGCGPGGGGFNPLNGNRGGGGGNGGIGGVGNEPNGGLPGISYGQPEAPEPGSGGAGGRRDNIDGCGGGLIWLDVSGAATINGVVSANGNPHSDTFTETGGGAGGGIYLACDTLTGSGAIRANGGTGAPYGGGGGGGRVAILANSATGWTGHVQLQRGPPVWTPVTYTNAENGTLYTTTSDIFPTTATTSDVWRAHGISSWTVDSLTLNKSDLAFEAPGITLTVSNHLSLTNQSALTLGVPNSTNRHALFVGGDLTVTNSSTFRIYAAATNAGELSGASVAATGRLTVASGCTVYPYSHNTNGGSVQFTVGHFVLATGARIDADDKGFLSDKGPGAGHYGAGGGYGGEGGYNNWQDGALGWPAPPYPGGAAYGSATAPTLPGSGGGRRNTPVPGGGLVWIHATNGTMTLNGTITANGRGDPGDRNGGGSGGGIYLITSYLYGTGLVSAAGGATPQYSGGGGGGGRIAVHARYFYHSLTTSVAGGAGGGVPASGDNGDSGTMVWGQLPAAPLVTNLAPTSVDYFSAVANGRLTATGTAPATVWVLWGTNDWTTNLDLWTGTNIFGGTPTNGQALSTNLTGLSSATWYYYRFYATNDVGDSWAESATNFRTLAGVPVVSNAPSGATEVTLASATLNGVLASTGTALTVVSVYWGPVDGGTNAALWGQTNAWEEFVLPGPFATNVMLAASNICYYYTFAASNADGMVWATPSSAFIAGNVSVSATDPDAAEKGPSKTGEFTVSRPATATNIPLTVTYALSGIADNGADYEALSGTVLMSAGASNALVTVVPLMDSVSDNGETVILSLTNGAYAIGAPSQDTVTIQDSTPSSSNVWTGTGNWTSYTNWSDEMMPIGGQQVTVAGSVTMAQATATLAGMEVNGTLTFSSTNAVLIASNITVNGTVTHVPNTDTNGADGWTPNGHVDLICTTLTVSAAGKIDVNGKGYGGGGFQAHGAGPGYGRWCGLTNNGAGGASYGGGGGFMGSRGINEPPYGTPAAPEPGSGGGGDTGFGGAGGGFIRIKAREVTLSGLLTANGAMGGSSAGSGSGGGVWLDSDSLSGDGSILANGGAGNSTWGSGGGGGRVAILSTNVAGWTGVINMSAGWTKIIGNDTLSECGTVWVATNALLPTCFTGRQWRVYGVTQWNPAQLGITNSSLIFEEPTHALSVGGDLTLGPGATPSLLFLHKNSPGAFEVSVGGSLAIGGGGSVVVGTNSTVATNRLTVGGNLTLSNGVLTVYSGATNTGSSSYGALVTVGSELYIGTGSVLHVVSDSTNGGSAKFEVRGLTVAANGEINASGRGWRVDNGPGKAGAGAGGGYGGVGGSTVWPASTPGGPTYGSSNAPTLPGSGGGSANGRFVGHGGGLIWIEATRDASIDGTLTANGASDTSDRCGAGSGGGIYLRCRQFTGAGSLLANGGSTPLHSGGGGGGGRIAVWSVYDSLTVTTTANGGDGANGDGDPGTVVRGRLSPPGTVFVVH